MVSVLFSIPKWLRLTLSMFYLGIIALLSLLPTKELPKIPLFAGADKIIHTFMYIWLTWMVCWMINAEKKQSWYSLAVLLSITWGVIMEVCQLNMHLGRSFDYYDILGNSNGTLLGLFVYIALRIKYKTLISNFL